MSAQVGKCLSCCRTVCIHDLLAINISDKADNALFMKDMQTQMLGLCPLAKLMFTSEKPLEIFLLYRFLSKWLILKIFIIFICSVEILKTSWKVFVKVLTEKFLSVVGSLCDKWWLSQWDVLRVFTVTDLCCSLWKRGKLNSNLHGSDGVLAESECNRKKSALWLWAWTSLLLTSHCTSI